MKNCECCLHSQGAAVASGTFPNACPFSTANVKNEARESTLRVLGTLTEPLGDARADTEAKILLLPGPFSQENYSTGVTHSPIQSAPSVQITLK